MNKSNFLLTLLAAAICAPAIATTTPLAGQRPNIVFILTDDLGYGDVACYGQEKIKTPRIDQMAAEGIRFTDGYSGSAVCAPARASLLTGLHTGHTKVRKNGNPFFAPTERTAAQMLKQANYRTAIFGKWGMDNGKGEGAPEKLGFDETLVYLTHTQAHDYTPPKLWKNGKDLPLAEGTYAPDMFTSAALDYLAKKDEKPFFLYLAYTTPHAHNKLGAQTGNGMEISSDAPYTNEKWPQPEKNKAAMITAMDTHVGMVLDALKQHGHAEKTLVIFTSDNGPHTEGGIKPEFFDSNGKFRGIKRDLYEGGIRVPFIAWWPQTIKPAVNDTPVAFWDFVPTAAELAGTKPLHDVDGVSLLPVLTGAGELNREYLYWELKEKRHRNTPQADQRALRMGNWKALLLSHGIELYDLSKDPSEENNIADAHPEIVAKAKTLFQTARTEPAAE